MSTPGPDELPPSIVTLLATATREIDTHVVQDGRCDACGQPWPCQRACLADMALAAL